MGRGGIAVAESSAGGPSADRGDVAGDEGGYGYAFAEEAPPPPSAPMAKKERPALLAKDVATPLPDADSGGDTGSSEAREPPASDAPSQTPEQDTRRPLLIYEAQLALAVFHVEQNLDLIETMAEEGGGYLVSRSQAHIVVRVPADRFQASIERITQLGDVTQRQVRVKDVTAEFMDLEIRMKNALAMRERLQQLLDKAEKVEEALKVEEQLSRVTEEIERMKGRLKLLRELIAFSTIQVQFMERQSEVNSRVRLPFPWLSNLGLSNLLDLD